MSFGSFRDFEEIPSSLLKLIQPPPQLSSSSPSPSSSSSFSSLETQGWEWDFLLNKKNSSQMNHAAFGGSFTGCVELSKALHELSEEDPSDFWDRYCLPFIRLSISEARSLLDLQDPQEEEREKEEKQREEIQHTERERERGGEVVLMPNATTSLRAVLETLVRQKIIFMKKRDQIEEKEKEREKEKENQGEVHKVRIAHLEPIYGATRKLIRDFLPSYFPVEPLAIHSISIESTTTTTTTAPQKIDSRERNRQEKENIQKRRRMILNQMTKEGESLFTESPKDILSALEKTYSQSPFHILVCDHVASQTGRILPLSDVISWSQNHNVTLVVDGTGNSDFLSLKEGKMWPDYYIASTHKWLGNVKTCAIVRVAADAPQGFQNPCPIPVGISFGYDRAVFDSEVRLCEEESPLSSSMMSVAERKSKKLNSHLWVGMTDYVPHIVLAKALRIYSTHCRKALSQASKTLFLGFKHCGLVPMLPFFDHQLWQSKKEEGEDDDDDDDDALIMRVVNLCPVRRWEYSIRPLQEVMDDRGIRVSCKSFNGFQFLRVSVNTYNTPFDFKVLGDFLNYDICLHSPRIALNLTSESIGSKIKKKEIYWDYLSIQAMFDSLLGLLNVESYSQTTETPSIHSIFCESLLRSSPLMFDSPLLELIKEESVIERVRKAGEILQIDDLVNRGWKNRNKIDSCCINCPWKTLSSQSDISKYLDSAKESRQQIRESISNAILTSPLSLPLQVGSFHWEVLVAVERSRHLFEETLHAIRSLPLGFLKMEENQKNQSVGTGGDLVDPIRLICNSSCTISSEVRPNRLLSCHRNDIQRKGEEKESDPKRFKPFLVSQFLVSNAEYLEFVKDGGYSDPRWWKGELLKNQREEEEEEEEGGSEELLPPFWYKVPDCRSDGVDSGDLFRLRLGLQVIPMPWDWPVEVTRQEAESFCRWKSFQHFQKSGKGESEFRLISRGEWEWLLGGTNGRERKDRFSSSSLSSSSSPLSSSSSWSLPRNQSLREFSSPCPIDLFGTRVEDLQSSQEDGDDGSKIFDLVGNVWQHCLKDPSSSSSSSPSSSSSCHDFDLVTDHNLGPIHIGRDSNLLVGGSWATIGNGDQLSELRKCCYLSNPLFGGIRYVCELE